MISKCTVANFFDKKASSLEFINFSKVFHLKQLAILFSKSLYVFFQDSTFSTSLYIFSIDQISFIRQTAFFGQNQSIQGILSDLSHTIDR